MMKFLVRIRVLPVAMFAAALILTAKVSSIPDLLRGQLEVAKVQAQQAPQNQPPNQPQAQAQPKGGPTPLQAPPAAPAPAQAPAAAPVQTAPAAAAAAAPGPVPASGGDASDPANDPTLLSQNEIDILQQLAERREVLERQSQEITQRQGLLAAAEQRIDRKIQELKTLQGAIDALVKKHNEQEEQRLQSLVKLYENMKPKDASRIFEELDYETLLMVAERMKERKLAPIMSSMDPTKAKEVTVRLSTLKKLPQPGASVGG